ncbi:MAG TPA: hypothetical protein VI796_05025 [Candidatus Thermoplasmatota archaeon]|nr:hypothetical protein [Candidatus Thermoplasmatota archaeon]
MLARSAAPATSAQAEVPDAASLVFPWLQPDPAGDESAVTTFPGSGTWVDIREMGATALPDGRLFFGVRMEDFGEVGGETGDDLVYSVFFAVGETPFQASYYTRFQGGQPGPASLTLTWQECGEIANTFSGPGCGKNVFKAGAWLTSNDTVVIEIAVHAIEGLTPGSSITGINFRTYDWIGLAANGMGILRDRVDATVEPLDFTYGSPASVPSATVSTPPPSPSTEPGPPSDSPSDPASVEETQEPNEPGGKNSPFPSVPATLLVMTAALAFARRPPRG